jgi:hypothetical protein
MLFMVAKIAAALEIGPWFPESSSSSYGLRNHEPFINTQNQKVL